MVWSVLGFLCFKKCSAMEQILFKTKMPSFKRVKYKWEGCNPFFSERSEHRGPCNQYLMPQCYSKQIYELYHWRYRLQDCISSSSINHTCLEKIVSRCKGGVPIHSTVTQSKAQATAAAAALITPD